VVDFLFQAALWVVPMVLAITLHEIAHGVAALALGDDTAKRLGRLSLNPLRHVDRFGTIILPGILIITQLLTVGRVIFAFGWAKPVPVDPFNFRRVAHRISPRRGMMLVALAGPAANFVLAFLAACMLPEIPLRRPVTELQYLDLVEHLYPVMGGMLVAFIVFNLVLGLFNLLPIPPLDGGRVMVGILPENLAMAWARLEGAGILIVLLAVFLLPNIAREFGVHFDPVNDALNVVLPWALGVILDLAGHGWEIGHGVRL
jgi:Zn-dependent protease